MLSLLFPLSGGLLVVIAWKKVSFDAYCGFVTSCVYGNVDLKDCDVMPFMVVCDL